MYRKEYKNLDDVMRELTFLKNISDGYDEYDEKLNIIAAMLALFNVQWQFEFEEENEKFIAKLK